jgi:VanZ family protein
MLIAALLVGVVVIYYGVIFQGQLPDHPALRGKNDLALHAAAFLVLSMPLLMALPARRTCVTLGLLLLAVGIEVIQVWLPRRNPGLDDVVASMAGVALAWALVGTAAILKDVSFSQEREKE